MSIMWNSPRDLGSNPQFLTYYFVALGNLLNLSGFQIPMFETKK